MQVSAGAWRIRHRDDKTTLLCTGAGGGMLEMPELVGAALFAARQGIHLLGRP